MLAKRPPLSQELQPEMLDPLAVADDKMFLDRLRQERNLPDYVQVGLSERFKRLVRRGLPQFLRLLKRGVANYP